MPNWSPYVVPALRAVPDFVDIEPGAPLVAVPPRKGQCWALSRGKDIARPWRCGRGARRGCCTCANHKRWEKAAREMRDGER